MFASVGAGAADLPAAPVYKAPPAAAVATVGGMYFWIDGSAQSVRLPSLMLGAHSSDVTGISEFGPSDPYGTQHASGHGIAGAVGFILPYGTLPAAFGSDARIELGGSYVHATASQSSGFGPSPNNYAFVQLTGQNGFVVGCGGIGCSTTSTESTTYDAWLASLKGASDYKFGILTLTPSLQAFGGSARSDESFFQQVGVPGSAFPIETYSASVPLRWIDVGAKFGVDARVDLTPAVAVGVGGTVGAAWRDASVTASDTLVTVSGPFTGLVLASQISPSASTTPFLANAEARLTVKPTRAIELRGFVGANYDSAVPGLASPTNPGPTFAANPGTPATIKFVQETSYYVGGGIKVSFGP
jgi:hypothetical protein